MVNKHIDELILGLKGMLDHDLLADKINNY